MKLLVLLGAGILFGAGLALSGMTNPARVIGFLDVAGKWDPTLAFVMAGALGAYALGMLAWRKRTKGRGLFGATLPRGKEEPVDWRLITGAALFGIGWGLSGFCPGPAIASLGALRLEAVIFVPAMAVGMYLARKGFGRERK